MNLILKDGTNIEIMDGSYENALIVQIKSLSEIASIGDKLTEDNLSDYTMGGNHYTGRICESGSWGGSMVTFNVREKSEIEYIKDIIDSSSLTDEQANHVPSLYDEWEPEMSYEVGERYRHNGVLYKCVQAHVSQSDWEPENTPALWSNLSNPTEEYPDWIIPTGAHDTYAKGAKVFHNGSKWVSEVDDNSWEPSVYGWSKVDDSLREET